MRDQDAPCPPLTSTQVFIQTGRRTYTIYKIELFECVVDYIDKSILQTKQKGVRYKQAAQKR